MDDESLNLNMSNRKIRKPLMERKRRARINKSLNELQQLLENSDYTSKGAKLEKADILELTVQYLKNSKHSSYSKEEKENMKNLLLERYLLGYEKCIEQVRTLITEIPGLDFNVQHQIRSHLQSTLEKVKKQTPTNGNSLSVREKENEKVNGCQKQLESTKNCSVLLQGSKHYKIFPSKLPNGDVILFLSSNMNQCDDEMRKSDMWRPW